MTFLRSVITEASTAADAVELLLPVMPEENRLHIEQAITALRAQVVTLEKFYVAASARGLTETEQLWIHEEVAIMQEGIDAFATIIEMLSDNASSNDATE